MLTVTQNTVDNLDWAVIGLSGLLLVVSIAGMLFAIIFGTGGVRRPTATAFSMLQPSRQLALLFAAGMAASEVLRLQLLWGPSSVVLPGGFYPYVFCRLYIGLMYGLFEPCFLLVVLFTCHYAVHGSGGAHGDGHSRCCGRGGCCGSGGCCGRSSPNMRILLLTALYCLPSLASQIVASLFTYMFSALHYSQSRTLRIFFSAYLTAADNNMAAHCTTEKSPDDCAFCTFPLLSTLASAVFNLCYLIAFVRSTQHVVITAISRPFVRRVRALQILMGALLVGTTVCRGLTALFLPWEWGFELLRLAHVVLSVSLNISITYIMVLQPMWDTAAADRKLNRHRRLLKKSGAADETVLAMSSKQAASTMGGRPRSSFSGTTAPASSTAELEGKMSWRDASAGRQRNSGSSTAAAGAGKGGGRSESSSLGVLLLTNMQQAGGTPATTPALTGSYANSWGTRDTVAERDAAPGSTADVEVGLGGSAERIAGFGVGLSDAAQSSLQVGRASPAVGRPSPSLGGWNPEETPGVEVERSLGASEVQLEVLSLLTAPSLASIEQQAGGTHYPSGRSHEQQLQPSASSTTEDERRSGTGDGLQRPSGTPTEVERSESPSQRDEQQQQQSTSQRQALSPPLVDEQRTEGTRQPSSPPDVPSPSLGAATHLPDSRRADVAQRLAQAGHEGSPPGATTSPTTGTSVPL